MSLTLVRPFTVVDAPQRSPAGFAARLGKLTGSRAATMLSHGQGRAALRRQLALERVTGRSHAPTFTSPAMLTGTQREPAAIDWYEALTGTFVTVTGFLASRAHQAGVSLDGHVGDVEGLLEVKCPQVLTHADYFAAGTLPAAHRKQVIHALWVTGAHWCDWLSFNPEFPPAQRAMLVRVERDAREIASYALAAALFLREVEAEVAGLERQGVA